VTVSLADQRIRTVLLDIEGTTTPISFVHETLFAYARTRLGDWLTRHAASPDGQAVVQMLTDEHAADCAAGAAPPAWTSRDSAGDRHGLTAYARWLMDRDRKSPGLKTLQGLVWNEGYQRGELHGIVYPDVPPALRRWRERSVQAAIYSSGSELAQRRLFASLPDGDLTALLTGFFDTAVGSKRESASYRRIGDALGHAVEQMLFVSDAVEELDAARHAGCRTALCVRDDATGWADTSDHPVVHSFDDIP
jgi:enolase-phosphatase E1